MSLKKYFQIAWSEPRRFFLWVALLSLAGLGLGFLIETQTSGLSKTSGFQALALLYLVACFLGFIVGVSGFALSWIPPIYRLEIQFLRRRFFALACLVTFVALINAEENWRGKRAWENFKQEWEAKGEHFDLSSFIPPPVSDEQNLAMTPLFKPTYNFTRATNTGVTWADTNGLNHLSRLRADLGSKNENKRLATGNLEKGSFANLEKCRDFYLGNTNYPQATKSGNAAEDILSALKQFDGEMEELTQAAASRPYSRFPIQYDYEPSSDILLPHLGYMKGLCFLFQIRAVSRLEVGQTEGAFRDLKVGFRLSDSIRDEPLLIDHLVRLATYSINLQTLREGLVRHVWNDAQLADLEKYLGSVDLLAELKHSMRGERAFNVKGIDFIRRQGILANRTGYYVDEIGGANNRARALTGFPLGFMPSGWLYQNMKNLSSMHQQFSIPVVDEQQHRVIPEIALAGSQAVEDLRKKFFPHIVFAKMMFPAFALTGMKSGRMQTFVDAARVSCALERYRLLNGNFPEKLDVLAPQFIGKIPTDVIDGAPLRYKRNEANGYILYSIGWNKTDDDGTTVWTKGKTPAADISRGDWVWKCPER